mgnify:CR=1 FL=1|tara:strand:- start:56277 stop:56789 length:513 start_codon:yes stop_codon:yes gene_type:complete
MIAIEREDEGGPGAALFIGVLGCAGLGATAGIDSGMFAVAHDAAVLPMAVALLTVLLVPALFVAASLSGLAIRLPDLGSAVAEGLRASGIASLGLIGPVLFLLASTDSSAVSRLLVSAVLLFVAVLGLRAIYVRLFRDALPFVTGLVLYLCWSLVFLGIGAKVVLQTLVI